MNRDAITRALRSSSNVANVSDRQPSSAPASNVGDSLQARRAMPQLIKRPSPASATYDKLRRIIDLLPESLIEVKPNGSYRVELEEYKIRIIWKPAPQTGICVTSLTTLKQLWLGDETRTDVDLLQYGLLDSILRDLEAPAFPLPVDGSCDRERACEPANRGEGKSLQGTIAILRDGTIVSQVGDTVVVS